MPRSFGAAPTQSATDIAAALMSEDAAPQTAAPEESLPPAQQEQEQPQPERGPRRDASGRFVPRDEPVPTEQEAQPAEPQPGEPATPAESGEPQIDYRAEYERQRAELERLRNTYANNTQQQREALEAARREAQELRQAQQDERQKLFDQARAEVDAMPDHDPRKAQAERQLAQAERQEAERIRREVEEERNQNAQAQQQQAAQQADLAARVGSWGVVEAYAATHGKALGLSDQEAQAALDSLKTDDLATLFRVLPAQQLVEHVRNVVGPRLHGELERRASTRLEENRQAAIKEGAHAHPRTPTADAPAPAYVAYTRENKNIRLGRQAATEAILAGILEE